VTVIPLYLILSIFITDAHHGSNQSYNVLISSSTIALVHGVVQVACANVGKCIWMLMTKLKEWNPV